MENFGFQKKFEGLPLKNFRIGDTVKVRRSNGYIEEGWIIYSITGNDVGVKKEVTIGEAEEIKARTIAKLETEIKDLTNPFVIRSNSEADADMAERKRKELKREMEKTSNVLTKRVSLKKLRLLNQ